MQSSLLLLSVFAAAIPAVPLEQQQPLGDLQPEIEFFEAQTLDTTPRLKGRFLHITGKYTQSPCYIPRYGASRLIGLS